MDTRGRTLCLITILVCFVNGTVSWGQTYNPTASDPHDAEHRRGHGCAAQQQWLRQHRQWPRCTRFQHHRLRQHRHWGPGAPLKHHCHNNTAAGVAALLANTTGIANTVSGFDALGGNTTGPTTPPPASRHSSPIRPASATPPPMPVRSSATPPATPTLPMVSRR